MTSISNEHDTYRILSVCGGGLRGIIAAAMLERMEALGRSRYGEAFRLSEAFDIASGSSTGAIIATAVALGIDARQIVRFYLDDAPHVFRRRRFAVPGVSDLYSSRKLHRAFEAVCGARRLTRTDLRTDLAIVTKALSEGRPLLLTTLEGTRDDCLGARVVREPLQLATLLAASTAAPGLFSPRTLTLGAQEVLCVDGGISPFNDPGLLTWSLATQTGLAARPCRVVSLGAGTGRAVRDASRLARKPRAMLAFAALRGIIDDAEHHAHALMTLLADEGRVDYVRHDLDLTAASFEMLGLPASRKALRRMRDIADPRGTAQLYEAAAVMAERLITQPPLRRTAPSLHPVRAA